MSEILIKISDNENMDISIKNEKSKKKIIIDYETKIINAQQIYEMLDYRLGNIYNVEREMNHIKESDENNVNYFEEIVKLLEAIADDIKDIKTVTEIEELETSEEIPSNIELKDNINF
jgi:hypothetical protein